MHPISFVAWHKHDQMSSLPSSTCYTMPTSLNFPPEFKAHGQVIYSLF